MSIPLKEKPCKGTGKAIGHGCGKPALYRTYGLGMSCCFAKWILNTEEGNKKLNKTIGSVQKPRLELENAEKEKKSSTALKRALALTKQVVHEYVRLRDKGLPCISCGEPWRSEFQAGHYHKAELYETLRFNPLNINGQCPLCNIRKDGNLEQYNINLPLRIGAEKYQELQELAQIDKHYSKVWNLDNLKEIRDEVRILIKELK